MEIPHKITFGYIINIYFKFSKKLDKIYDDFKDWTYFLKNKFDVGTMCLRLELLELLLNFSSNIRNNILFSNF